MSIPGITKIMSSSGSEIEKVLDSSGIIVYQKTPIQPYIKFVGTSSFTLKQKNVSSKTWDGTIEYSTDGLIWRTWQSGGNTISSSSSAPYELYLRGIGNTKITGSFDSRNYRFVFTTTGTIDCLGRIDTLLDYQTVLNGGSPSMANHCYASMFNGCTSLTTAPTLPAKTLSGGCYEVMFNGCTSLTTAPTLPATVMKSSCYRSMFQNTKLISPPILHATTLATECYYSMFDGCYHLTSLPALPATKLATSCYSNMFNGCYNIRLSDTQTGVYQTPYRIPTTGTGVDSATSGLNYMFRDTGGTFTGTPSINTTYFTSNSVVG